MHIKIELDAFGYFLFVISCFFLLLYLCVMIWKDNKKKMNALEELELMKRLREVEKKIIKNEKNSDNFFRDKFK